MIDYLGTKPYTFSETVSLIQLKFILNHEQCYVLIIIVIVEDTSHYISLLLRSTTSEINISSFFTTEINSGTKYVIPRLLTHVYHMFNSAKVVQNHTFKTKKHVVDRENGQVCG